MTKKTIIITGASSGLGKALAIECANEYNNAGVRLFLFGRSQLRLEQVADLVRQKGAEVTVIAADITDKNLMNMHLSAITDKNEIDIVIACAGVSAGTLNKPETISQIEKIFAVNWQGALNSVMPLLPKMIARKCGNIVFISSMAGILGLASSPSYSASKGAVRIFAQGLQGYLQKYNVNVLTVIAGYIDTPMTAVNNFPMPLMVSPDKAAKKIINALEKKKGTIAFPFIIYLLLKLLSILPDAVIRYLNSKLPSKPAFEEDN